MLAVRVLLTKLNLVLLLMELSHTVLIYNFLGLVLPMTQVHHVEPSAERLVGQTRIFQQ